MSLFTGSYSQSRSLQNSTSSNLTSFTSLPRCLTWSCSIDFERYKRAADPRLIQNSEVLKLLREQESGVERGGVGGGGQHRSYSEHFLTRKQSFFGQQSTLDTSQGITEDAYCVPPPPPPSSPTEIIISGSCKKSLLTRCCYHALMAPVWTPCRKGYVFPLGVGGKVHWPRWR